MSKSHTSLTSHRVTLVQLIHLGERKEKAVPEAFKSGYKPFFVQQLMDQRGETLNL